MESRGAVLSLSQSAQQRVERPAAADGFGESVAFLARRGELDGQMFAVAVLARGCQGFEGEPDCFLDHGRPADVILQSREHFGVDRIPAAH